MRNLIAVIFLVLGTGMLVWGYRESDSIKGRIHQVVSSSTKNRITWMYVGGAVLLTAGACQIFFTGKK